MTDDPFNDLEKTIIATRPQNAAQAKAASAVGMDTNILAGTLLGGINPVERAASKLLTILVSIKQSSSHPDPKQLHQQLTHEIDQFRETIKPLVATPKALTRASYVLCTAIDEAVLNTPWGHNSDWSQHNLLATFHGEVHGGERFFELLKRLGTDPENNADLLELMYVCLSLGYEGTYKLAGDGQATLLKVRQWLHGVIQANRMPAPVALAHHWHSANVPVRKVPRSTPFWVTCATAAGLCALVYFTLLTSLSAKTEKAVGTFLPLSAPTLAPIRPPAPAPEVDTEVLSIDALTPPFISLSVRLDEQISAGALSIIESSDHALIRLVGDNLFASGRAEINAAANPLLTTIATALNPYDGTVLITGHTDNIPIKRADFPSNLDLSQARAESVLTHLAAVVSSPQRLVAEGVGELQPLTDNSTKKRRGENRRVELTLFY